MGILGFLVLVFILFGRRAVWSVLEFGFCIFVLMICLVIYAEVRESTNDYNHDYPSENYIENNRHQLEQLCESNPDDWVCEYL